MVFGVLFGVCTAIVRYGVGESDDTGAWLSSGRSEVEWALGLLPFAGIFFLWIVGVEGA
jgi:hypothetical protein